MTTEITMTQTTSTTALDRLSTAERALAQCRTIEDAQIGVAIAESARYHAQRVKAGARMENFATSIKVKYEIKLAELVDEGQATGQIATAGKPSAREGLGQPLTLAELGIDAPRLLEARRIAAVFTSADIDAIVDAANAEGASVSRRALIIAANRARAGAAPAASSSENRIEHQAPKADPTAAERQRRHRLLESMRPDAPLAEHVEPLEVASAFARQAAEATVHPDCTWPHVEALELNKQLAWWPRG
jgi:hypothetical protein